MQRLVARVTPQGRSRQIHPAKPHHPHLATEALEPGVVYEFAIEIWPICNVFRAAPHASEIANADSIIASQGKPHVTIRNKATNSVHEGGRKASRLVVPMILR
jgi:hypothetical protein